MTPIVDAHHPHLAAGRSAVAHGADAAAHLRALRAAAARLSDRGISRRYRGLRHREIGLCAGQLGQGAFRGRDRLGAEDGGRNRLAACHRRLCRFHGRRCAAAARSPCEISAGARRAHAAALARESAISLRGACRPLRRSGFAQERRAPEGLWLELRPAGVCAADGGRRRARRIVSRISPSSCNMPGCWKISRPRAAMPGVPACRRSPSAATSIPSCPALGTFIHRNDPDHIAAVVGETVAIFGPDRCLFGSNFPIEKLWTSYADLIAAYRKAAASFSPADQDAIFRGTARASIGSGNKNN